MDHDNCIQAPDDESGDSSDEATSESCDQDNLLQVWSFESLESSGTWFHIKNKETGQCLKTKLNSGNDCDEIGTGDCDKTDATTGWARVGASIPNYQCTILQDGDNNTDWTLKGRSNGGELEFTSESSGDDAEETKWILVPTPKTSKSQKRDMFDQSI